MTYGTRTLEEQLENKGYYIYRTMDSSIEAEKLVKELRSKGYYARTLEYSTMVRGYHDYAVWCKYKG